MTDWRIRNVKWCCRYDIPKCSVVARSDCTERGIVLGCQQSYRPKEKKVIFEANCDRFDALEDCLPNERGHNKTWAGHIASEMMDWALVRQTSGGWRCAEVMEARYSWFGSRFNYLLPCPVRSPNYTVMHLVSFSFSPLADGSQPTVEILIPNPLSLFKADQIVVLLWWYCRWHRKAGKSESDSCTPRNLKQLTISTAEPLMWMGE